MAACKTCTHPDAVEIDGLLVAGASQAQVAERFGLARTSVGRHANTHLRRELAEAEQARIDRGLDRTLGILERVKALAENGLDYADRALAANAPNAPAALREATALALRVAELTGEADPAREKTHSLLERIGDVDDEDDPDDEPTG